MVIVEKSYSTMIQGRMVVANTLCISAKKTNDSNTNNNTHTNSNNTISSSSNNGIIIKVKPMNVLQMNVKVTLYGLQRKATLNGRTATTVGWDHQKERYYISYTTNTATATTTAIVISVKPSNIVYSKGTIVHIMGANQQQQSYDSKWGTVVEFIDYGNSHASSTVSSSVGNTTTTKTNTTTTTCNGRYDIQLSTNNIVRVKFDTVRA